MICDRSLEGTLPPIKLKWKMMEHDSLYCDRKSTWTSSCRYASSTETRQWVCQRVATSDVVSQCHIIPHSATYCHIMPYAQKKKQRKHIQNPSRSSTVQFQKEVLDYCEMNPFQHRTGWGKRDEYGPVPRLSKLLSFGVVDDLVRNWTRWTRNIGHVLILAPGFCKAVSVSVFWFFHIGDCGLWTGIYAQTEVLNIAALRNIRMSTFPLEIDFKHAITQRCGNSPNFLQFIIYQTFSKPFLQLHICIYIYIHVIIPSCRVSQKRNHW